MSKTNLQQLIEELELLLPDERGAISRLRQLEIDNPTSGGSPGGSLPAGGTTGQILEKLSAANGDAGWADPSVSSGSLPTGGTTGQVLEKLSAVNGDAGWATALSPSSNATISGAWAFTTTPTVSGINVATVDQLASTPYFATKSGFYFTCPEVPSSGSATPGSGYLTAHPVLIPASVTVVSIGVNVITALASSFMRLGIYNDDGTMRPGTLLLDAGQTDSSTTGFKEIVISQALTAGIYWLVAAQQGGTGSVGCRSVTPTIPIPGPSANVGGGPVYGMSVSSVAGAMPSSYGSPAFYYTSTNGNGAVHRVVLKAA